MKHRTTLTLAAGLLAYTLLLANGCSADQGKQRPNPLRVTLATFHHQRSQQEPQPEVKIFTGKISKSGQKFVLKDDLVNTSYQLDDQKKAQQYQGKKVRVTGTLHAEKNLIRVQAIDETA
jgi:phosphoribosylpyrophosphate synthetase